MPRLKLPNGQYMRIPENATQEDVDAAIASLPEEMRTAPAPVEAAPEAAPPGAFSQVVGSVDTTAQTPSVLDGFKGAGGRFVTAGQGIMHSLKGTGRAAQQIGAFLTQDDEWKQQLEADEAAAREKLASSPQAFKDANLIGNIMQAGVPAGGAAKLGVSAGGNLLRLMAAEGAVGAGAAALQPTTKDESRSTNVALGGTVGALLPAVGRGLARAPIVRSVIGNTPEDRIAGQREVARETRRRVEQLRTTAGKKIEDISATAELKLQPLAKELKAVRRTYGDAMDQASAGAKKNLDELIMLGNRKGVVLKDKVREMRTAALRAEDAAEGAAKSGFQKVRELIDRGIDEGILPSNVDKLRRARTTYRTRREIAEMEALRRQMNNPRGQAALRVGANLKATQDRDE